jgi:hypothetical protein
MSLGELGTLLQKCGLGQLDYANDIGDIKGSKVSYKGKIGVVAHVDGLTSSLEHDSTVVDVTVNLNMRTDFILAPRRGSEKPRYLNP